MYLFNYTYGLIIIGAVLIIAYASMVGPWPDAGFTNIIVGISAFLALGVTGVVHAIAMAVTKPVQSTQNLTPTAPKKNSYVLPIIFAFLAVLLLLFLLS